MDSRRDEPCDASLHARGLLEFAEGLGLDARGVFETSGVPFEDLERPLGSLPFTCLERAFQAIADLTGDALVGLHLGEHPSPRGLGLIGYYLTANDRADQLVEQCYSLLSRISDVFEISVKFGDEAQGRFVLRPRIELERARHLAEANLSCFVGNVRRLIRPDFVPHEVCLMHGPLGPTAEYERVFGCPVRFFSPAYRVCFDGRIGEASVQTSDHELRAALEPYVPFALQDVLGPREKDLGTGTAEPSRLDVLSCLTPREREIAMLVVDGYTSANVAARLGIAEGTVAVHMRRIFRKLGVHSRVELVRAVLG